MAPDQWTWLARIRRPQGRKGEVFAEVLTDFPERFAERECLWLLPDTTQSRSGPTPLAFPRKVQLIGHWLHRGNIVLHFAGVDSISAAQGLVGLIVGIPRAERAALAEGEAYIIDLVGCLVIDVGGPNAVTVGRIEDIDRTAGPVPLLIVGSAREEVLIPFAKDYLRNVDLAARRLEMALPEGLLNLNRAK